MPNSINNLFGFMGQEDNGPARSDGQMPPSSYEGTPSHAADQNSSSRPAFFGASAPPQSTATPLRFDEDSLAARLRQASEQDLNSANFGIIKIDNDGVVEFFNRYESELSGVAPTEAIGRNFFTQVAPCSNNRLFRGRFKKGVRQGSFDETFSYTYTYKMRPTLVEVRLLCDSMNTNWIVVRKC